MRLQQVAELEDRRFVGNAILPEVEPHKAPHGLAVVERFLRPWVAQIEPLLQEIDAQHLLQSEWRPTLARLGIMRSDPIEEPVPRNHGIHFGKKALATRDFLLAFPRQSGEGALLSHEGLRVRCAGCITVQPAHQTHHPFTKTFSEFP